MAQYDINLREYWRILKKRKLIVIITAILLGLFSTFFAVIQAPTPLYTSVSSIKFEKETTLEGLYSRTFSWTGSDDIETQMSVITGFSVLLEVGKNIGLIPRDATGEEPEIIASIDRLKAKVQIERENFTNILNIMVTDSDPEFTQRMANELATSYKVVHAEQQGKRTDDAIKYIDEQLSTVREKLKSSEEEFNRFSQVNQLISIDLQSENLLSRQKEINDEIRRQDEDKSEIEALSARVSQFLQDPSGSEVNLYSSKASPQYQTTNNSFVELFLKKDTLLENYTSQHPEVIAIELKIVEQARKMKMLLDQQIDTIEKRKSDLREELDTVDRKTSNLMEKKLEYDRLKREVESFSEMTVLLEQKSQEALIKKAEKPEEVVIVRKALLPTSRINPPKTATTGAMGMVIGIVLGLVFAFIVETFDTSLGAIEDVEETLGAKVLGVIPHTDSKEVAASLKDRYPRDMDESFSKRIISLVSHFAPKTMISESFRALRTNIQFREGDEKVKTIAITSTSPQEGKTLVSVNLSISLAQAGLKTLLVGADLRKPMIAQVFGLEESPGLTDIILGNYPWPDTVKTITDIIMGRMTMDDVMITPGMDNLHIITGGNMPPNPAELIDSKRLVDFIEEAKKRYDIIIFDSTPVLSTADAAILGKKVDGVLIVYRVGAVSRGLLKRTSTQLEQVHCDIIGVILNGMKPDISPDFPDYKYYKYYSYYGEDTKQERGGADRQKKRGFFSRWLLIIAGLLLLGTGILWNSGMFTCSKSTASVMPVKKTDIRHTADKKASSAAGQTEATTPEALYTRSTPVKDIVSEPPATQEADDPVEDFTYQQKMFPFSVCLGSFLTVERAERAITLYEQKGVHAFWVKVNLEEKGIWYRVYAGYFREHEQAQRFIQENGLKEADIKKTVYANLIGIYNTSEDLGSMIQSIKDLGYSPYVVKDQDNNTPILFVGAYLTRTGAEEQEGDLRSDGVISRLVER